MPLPSMVRPRAPCDAMEALEQMRQLGLGNAGAGVAHAELGAARRRLLGRTSTAISPSKVNLKRVRQQVEDDLLPHVAIDMDRLAGSGGASTRSARPARSMAERKVEASSAVKAARSTGS